MQQLYNSTRVRLQSDQYLDYRSASLLLGNDDQRYLDMCFALLSGLVWVDEIIQYCMIKLDVKEFILWDRKIVLRDI